MVTDLDRQPKAHEHRGGGGCSLLQGRVKIPGLSSEAAT